MGGGLLEETQPEAAQLNADVAAKLRYSRAGGGEGLADESPPSAPQASWSQNQPAAPGTSPSAHGSFAGLFSRHALLRLP